MSDKPTPPHVYANHVIKQMVEHAFGGDLVIEYEDYHTMRTAFRACGGQWQTLSDGDPEQVKILSMVVSTWGQLPGRRHKKDRVI